MDEHQLAGQRSYQRVSGKTVVLASVAGLVIGGPLMGLMGLSFLATGALFLVTSPLLLIFSPLLLGAGFVFVTALAGFGVAAVMAIGAMSSFAWVFRSLRGPRLVGLDTGSMADIVIHSGDKAKDTGKDWAGYLQQTMQNPVPNSPQENWPNRG